MKILHAHRLSASLALLLLMSLAVALPGAAAGGLAASATGEAGDLGSRTYTNPLHIQIPGDGLVGSCADPSIIHADQPGDSYWYIYCTTDPLNDNDKDPNGNFNFHLIPMLRSYDLVNWTYMGDAFSAKPSWVAPNAGLWAPDIRHFNGQYYLYFTASDTSLPGGGSAIGVATSASPLGPWVDSGAPVVEPHEAPCCPGSRRWVYDPDVVEAGGQKYIFYGSYFGGISARMLSPDGLHSNPATQVQITIANRYEGTYVVYHDGYYYLFASATDCCRGPLTGYSVFVGRSPIVLGPYVDKEGASLLEGRVGGTVALSLNGNEWVGTGHNAVFQDFDGQWWTVYHAVNRFDPYFDGAVGFTKRPVLMDALDWVEGWPTARGGQWASDTPVQAPAAQPGWTTNYHLKLDQPDIPGEQISQLSDEFNEATLSPQWSWVRPPDPSSYGLTGTTFRFDTQNADLFEDSNNASVLTEPTPDGPYIVEAKLNLNVPPEGCCFNYTQAGLVIYGNDDNYIKLDHVSIWETRQTEFAKELFPVPAGYPRYGNTVVGPPGDWTYLRIVKSNQGGEENYRAYTSRDGITWERGGVWTHNLGSTARIGLVSMGGSGFTANFDYVRVYKLNH
jgi:arabinan endo-1,5-alpha-L-arabinosidase